MEPEKETEPIKVYSSYTEAQKRATKKYREQNKEKVNAQRKKYYDERKEKDPNFLQYKREKAKEYYIRKKGVKEEEDKTDEEEIEVVDVITDKTEPEVDNGEDLSHLIPQIQEAIKILETPDEKKKRKPRSKKEQKENIKPEDLEELKQILIESSKVVEEVPPTTPEPEQVVKVPKTPRPKKNKKAV